MERGGADNPGPDGHSIYFLQHPLNLTILFPSFLNKFWLEEGYLLYFRFDLTHP